MRYQNKRILDTVKYFISLTSTIYEQTCGLGNAISGRPDLNLDRCLYSILLATDTAPRSSYCRIRRPSSSTHPQEHLPFLAHIVGSEIIVSTASIYVYSIAYKNYIS